MTSTIFDRKENMVHGPITHRVPTAEGVASPIFSSMAAHFANLNMALAAAIDAERDLDHLNGSDPSVDPWLREAEAAWRNVDAILVAISATPIRHTCDQALLAVSRRVFTRDSPRLGRTRHRLPTPCVTPLCDTSEEEKKTYNQRANIFRPSDYPRWRQTPLTATRCRHKKEGRLSGDPRNFERCKIVPPLI